jgi:ankyrin repeat protein
MPLIWYNQIMNTFKNLVKVVILLYLSQFTVYAAEEDYIWITPQISIDRVKELIARGVDVNKPWPGRESDGLPIHRAAWYGYTEIASLLIDAGANIDAQNRQGETPLMIAIQNGFDKKYEMVVLLIEAGADVNIRNGSALAIAFQRAQWDIVSRLLEAGADPQLWDIVLYDQTHFRFLEALVMRGMQNELTILMERGLNLKERRWQWLIFNALKDIDMLRFLAEAGMEINIIGRNQLTLLQDAILESRDAALWLIDRGVNVNYGSRDEMSALMWAVNRGDIELVKILLEAGADVNLKRGTQTALSYAFFYGEDEIALLLIGCGADVKVLLFDGWSTLMWAVYSDSIELADKLIKAGVDVNYRTPQTRQTALMIAVGDVNHTTTDEDFLLYDNLAAMERNPAMVRLLLEAGADISLVNTSGRNALYYAENVSRNEEIIRLIRERR